MESEGTGENHRSLGCGAPPSLDLRAGQTGWSLVKEVKEKNLSYSLLEDFKSVELGFLSVTC